MREMMVQMAPDPATQAMMRAVYANPALMDSLTNPAVMSSAMQFMGSVGDVRRVSRWKSGEVVVDARRVSWWMHGGCRGGGRGVRVEGGDERRV